MKKIKLALLTLLGFSTACSTVREAQTTPQVPAEAAQKEDNEDITPPEGEQVKVERIQLMYGVPSPRPTSENTATPAEEPTK